MELEYILSMSDEEFIEMIGIGKEKGKDALCSVILGSIATSGAMPLAMPLIDKMSLSNDNREKVIILSGIIVSGLVSLGLYKSFKNAGKKGVKIRKEMLCNLKELLGELTEEEFKDLYSSLKANTNSKNKRIENIIYYAEYLNQTDLIKTVVDNKIKEYQDGNKGKKHVIVKN